MSKGFLFVGVLTVAALGVSLFGGRKAGANDYVPTRSDAVVKTDAEWQAELPAEQYRILRRGGTEMAWTGQYVRNHDLGVYACAACGLPLFEGEDKFESGTGWPSFTTPIGTDHVGEHEDRTLGVTRTEVLCNRCGGHLGHVFPDGPAPTGLRYCINGNVLDFMPREVEKPEVEG